MMTASLLGLLAFAKICGEAASFLNQPSIIGELAAGILLGPTVLGHFSPEALAFFRGSGEPKLFALLIQFSLLVFLFGAGAEVSIQNALKHVRVSVAVCLSGWVAPFVLGLLVVYFAPRWSLDRLAGSAIHGDLGRLALFVATALSISAVPVIAKTLMDLGLYKSRMGVVTMSAAVSTDVLAWLVFALIGGGLGHGVYSLLAFSMGLLVSFTKILSAVWLSRLAHFSRDWLAPLFFASVGLKVDFIAHFDLLVMLTIFFIACLGKIVGCGLAARWAGLPLREAWAVGFAMNARGAMEVILGIAALDSLLISPTFFVALVIMAFATSMMSGPLISRQLSDLPLVLKGRHS